MGTLSSSSALTDSARRVLLLKRRYDLDIRSGLNGKRISWAPSSYDSFARRYEHARRALRAERRTALLGFPLPAAQRIDARYEKTYRAVAEKPPPRASIRWAAGTPHGWTPVHEYDTHCSSLSRFSF